MPAYCFLGCPWPIRSSSARSTIWRLPGALCSSRIRSAAWLPHIGPHCCSSHCQGTWQHDLPKGTQSTVVSCTASVGRWEMQLWGLSAHADHSQHREVITVSGEVSLAGWGARSGTRSRLRAAISVTALLLRCPMPLIDLPPCAGLQDMPAQSLLCTWMLCLLRTCKVLLPHHAPRDFKMVEWAKMHWQPLWKVYPGLVSWISQPWLCFHSF